MSLYSKASVVADSRMRVHPGKESFSRIGSFKQFGSMNRMNNSEVPLHLSGVAYYIL